MLNLGTGTSRSFPTDSTGSFAALQLAVGNYQVRIEKQGFQASVMAVVVRSGEVAVANASLQVGSVTQSVTVPADARTYLDVDSPQVATAFDATTIQNIPSLDRDPGGPDVPSRPASCRSAATMASCYRGVTTRTASEVAATT